ncbi:MAG: hypothetical protein SF187_22920 [Deltaproteobacteria bacterium]|nr:hypothetical protein [Deltaproteobacteria bacterium]
MIKSSSRFAGPIILALSVLAAWFAKPGAAQTPAAPNESESDNVTITFATVPPVRAQVWWGRKRLGMIKERRTLVIERPRDSGPLDVTVTAQGFLPVHTRAYTFNDYRLTVKLTPEAEKQTLFGYRAPVPDAGANPDAL